MLKPFVVEAMVPLKVSDPPDIPEISAGRPPADTLFDEVRVKLPPLAIRIEAPPAFCRLPVPRVKPAPPGLVMLMLFVPPVEVVELKVKDEPAARSEISSAVPAAPMSLPEPLKVTLPAFVAAPLSMVRAVPLVMV